MHIYSVCRKEIHGTTVEYQPRFPRQAEWMGKGNGAENISVYKIRIGKESACRSNQKGEKTAPYKVQVHSVRS